jgi:hypothetical protein
MPGSKIINEVGSASLSPISKILEVCKTEAVTPAEIEGAVASDIANDTTSVTGYLSNGIIKYTGVAVLLLGIPLLLALLLPMLTKKKRPRKRRKMKRAPKKRARKTYKKRTYRKRK